MYMNPPFAGKLQTRRSAMKTFDVQSIEINAPFDKTFGYIADAHNLPSWASAFKSVADGHAIMQTPNGSIEVALTVNTSYNQGTIDWGMTFPDQTVANAYSRVVEAGDYKSIYSFILLPPPVPLEQLEGALEAQAQILREELIRLGAILGKES
jgi:hypothetical protein